MKNVLIILGFLISFSLFAQPANDDCANAIALPLQLLETVTYTTGNLGNATESTPACSGTVSTDVWYYFTANSEGTRIYMPSQSGLDVAFEIYDACGGSSIVCVDNNSTNVSECYYNYNFIIGQTYYVKVFLYNQSFTDASFEIAVIDIPAAPNDECIDAVNLIPQVLNATNFTTSNLGGATESTSACSGSISTDVWFSFTANSPGNLIKLQPESGLDLVFQLYDSCGGTSLMCIDSNGVNFSEAMYSTFFTVGQTYYIKVYLKDQYTYDAPIHIAVIDIPTPANDVCTSSVDIPVHDETHVVYVAGNLGGALESMAPCEGSTGADVWFSFTAVSSTATIRTTAESGFDPVLQIFDSCGGASIACVDNNGVNFNETYYGTDFVAGQQYLVRVFAYNQIFYDKEFSITVYDPNAGAAVNELDENDVKLYPNPVNKVLNVKKEGTVSFQLLSITGAVLFESNFEDFTSIDISFLQKGIYLIKLLEAKSKNVIIKKFIVQ